jgi:DNA-binding response OmpR family regulator
MTTAGSHVVCIVDDDVDLRATLRRQLEEAGLRVCEASSGREAVDVVLAAQAAVAIVDIVMPDQEGLETIRTLRQQAPGILLLAMSGYDDRYLNMALKLGADDALRKPFTGRDLLARVRRLLDLMTK